MSRALTRRLLVALALVVAGSCGYDFSKYKQPGSTTGTGGMTGTSSTSVSTTGTGGMAASSGTAGLGGMGGATASVGTTGGSFATATSGAGGATSWCAIHEPGVTFCEDFDGVPNVQTLVARWNGAMDATGTLSIEQPMGAPSMPNALLATATSSGHAYVSPAPFFMSPSTIVLAYDLRVDKNSIGINLLSVAALTGLVMGQTIDADPTVALFLTSIGIQLGWNDPQDGGTGFTVYDLHTQPSVQAWDGRWSLTINTTTGSMAVTHNGTPVGDPPALPSSFWSPTMITLAAGLPYNTAGTGAMDVTIDNLVLDLQQ